MGFNLILHQQLTKEIMYTPDSIRSILSLRDLAEEAGAVFRGVSSNPSSACPLHGGDNPTAFHLYDDGQRWHCFTRCPDSRNDGDIIAFYMFWKQIDYRAAMADLADRAGIPSDDNISPIRRDIPGFAIPRDFIENIAWLNRPSPSLDSPLLREAVGDEVARLVGPQTANREQPNALWQSRAQAFIDYARAQLLHSQTGAPARAYLSNERGLQPMTWDAFSLGYNPTDLFDDPATWGLTPTSQSLDCKKVFLPRGLVIPGILDNLPRYIKIRRPQPNDPLSEYLPPVSASPHPRLTVSKFLSLRGSHPAIFGSDAWIEQPNLLLTEGEWDCMLAWQFSIALCDRGVYFDVATLGSASNRAALPDLVALARYPRILAVYDDDPAGDRARQYLNSFARIQLIPPPAHDLTDYFRSGGDLHAWLASILTSTT
jgi:hypothetical protein